jgi:glycosyltransferase involved in cell wall biosynthesis
MTSAYIRPLKILAVAYACNPVLGSEEGVGWGWVKAIASRHEVDVITAGYHRNDIERAQAREGGSFGNIRFHYVPEKSWHYRPTPGWKLIENTPLKPIMNLSYSGWQVDAFRLACRLQADVGFDLVHLVTYVGFRFPGRFWRMDVPLVWGPIGGLENTPWRFLPMMGPAGAFYYAGRNIYNSLQILLLPGPKKSFAKASGAIIAATEGIRREIRRRYGQASDVICEIGPPGESAETPVRRGPGEPIRLIWSGQHQPGKALPLLLRALALIGDRFDWRLTVLGRGRSTTGWKWLARELGLGGRCSWPGWIPRDEAVRMVKQAHVGVITSLKDLTSTVLLEFLSAGLPVICPDCCGFTNVITPDCGIKLAVRTPRQLVADLAAALERLAGDEDERRRLAEGALRRIGDFSWEGKAAALDKIYRRAAG